MSVHQYFAEVEAVVSILDEFVKQFDAEDDFTGVVYAESEAFAAIWQAGELLARAYQVLIPLVQLDLAKQALNLPDVQVKQSGLILPDVPLPGLEDL